MRNLLVFSFVFFALSCTRGFYNTNVVEYDYEEAYNLVHGLLAGTLVVQIPCHDRKLELLQLMVKNEEDPKKKATYQNRYFEELVLLTQAQQALISSVSKYYTFSNYVFVPDTLVNAFKNGQQKNIFLDADLKFDNSKLVDTTKTILYLRDLRDYDHLFIHKPDGSYPPRPFPSSTQLTMMEFGDLPTADLPETMENSSIYSAIRILNKRLEVFIKQQRAPD